MIIRKARIEEAGKLKEIVDLVNRNGGFPPEWIRQSASDSAPDKEMLLTERVFVAEEDGELKGFYSLDDRGKLEQLCVLPESSGTGVGKELFLHAKEMGMGEPAKS